MLLKLQFITKLLLVDQRSFQAWYFYPVISIDILSFHVLGGWLNFCFFLFGSHSVFRFFPLVVVQTTFTLPFEVQYIFYGNAKMKWPHYRIITNANLVTSLRPSTQILTLLWKQKINKISVFKIGHEQEKNFLYHK